MDLLNALPFAAQIRSYGNKITASNQKGDLVFGSAENPFFFLKGSKQNEDLKKLENALLQHSPFSLDFIQNDTCWHVHLAPLSDAMLITAQDEPQRLNISQVTQTQLDLFQNIIQNINIPFYLIDISGEIIYINSDFSTLIGYPYEKILGQKITAFLNLSNLNFEQRFETETTISTPQGLCPFLLTQVQIQTQTSPLFLGALHPVIAPQLDNKNDNIPLPYAKISVDSQIILQTNGPFSNKFNQANNPKQLSDIFTDETLQKLTNKLTKSHNRLDSEKSIELATHQGDSYQVYATWASPDEAEANLYFIDITPKKQLETQVMQTYKMQAVGQLTGGIAHDFNNILTAIMGFTDLLLQQHPAGDSAFADLMHIKGNVQKAAGLVGQLLTFSRKTPVQEHMISVHDAFVDLTSLLQRAIAPHCHLTMDYKRHLGFIKMDINQLTQVFLNFAVNAKDAMPKGGELTISIAKEDVKKARLCGSDTISTGSYVKISITDTGKGIPADILPHIFDPFFTTKKKSNQSGTGLGLSTVYGIIHSVGGFIKVDSIENVGTTFTVYLPRFDEKGEIVTPQPTEIQNVFLPTPKAPILLVDDEESIRTVTARALQAKGFEVTQASNAEDALKLIQDKSVFQLLITDMVMPSMDGEHLIKEAKKFSPDLPCLLMSGYSDSYEKHTSNKAKNFDFIAKPFVLADLLTKVKEILEKNQKV
ncbi:MAG: response regulator [Alphaproteobacteria bacterium]|nr:response regulator [Alphaproteobacteria bacterium]